MLLFFPWLVHHQIIERKIVKCTSSIQLENQLSIIQSKQSAKNKKFVLRSIFRIGFVAIQLKISKKWQSMTSFSFICKLNQQMRFSKPKKVKETNIKHFYFEKKHQLTWWLNSHKYSFPLSVMNFLQNHAQCTWNVEKMLQLCFWSKKKWTKQNCWYR